MLYSGRLLPCKLVIAVALCLCTAGPVLALTCDTREFGAKADGRTKDTAAIQKAIDSCAVSGGLVRFSAGIYVSAPLALKSHTHLLLERGATLLGSAEMTDYP